MARRRMTPVVVSSVPAMTPSSNIGALGQRDGNQVSAVIHGDVRLVIERRHNVLIVGVVVLALDGEHRDVVVAHQARGDVVLRGERVGSAEYDVGAAVAQRDRQVRRLGRDVQAGRNAHALQRLVLDELLADDLKDLHRLVRPVNALLPKISQFEVGDIARDACCSGRHNLLICQLSVSAVSKCSRDSYAPQTCLSRVADKDLLFAAPELVLQNSPRLLR